MDLWQAFREKETAEIKKILEKKDHMDIRDKHGWTPLMRAAQKNFLDIAKLILKKGARVNSKNNQGGFPLLIACCYQSFHVAKLLFEEGANPKEKYKGETLLECIDERYPNIILLCAKYQFKCHSEDQVYLKKKTYKVRFH